MWENPLPGLYLWKNFLTIPQENDLWTRTYQQPWNHTLKRKTQHYGYEYAYSSRHLQKAEQEIPDWLHFIIQQAMEKVKLLGIVLKFPDQAIINEYEPGQGIAHHIDDQRWFDDTVWSLSLGSDCIMDFKKDGKVTSLHLPQKTLLIMTGSARSEYTHGIVPRKTDIINNKRQLRTTRVSITFRHTIKNNK